LSHSKGVYKTRMWYISHELLSFGTKKARGGPKGGKLVVWENLVLIRAKSPEEAYRKALKHGRLNEEKVKIDGEDGYCRFKGLKDLVLIYDDLKDGSELEWHDLRLDISKLRSLVKPKGQMQAFSIGPKGS
jgi:hypothetical protein